MSGTPNYNCGSSSDRPPTWDPRNVPYGTYRVRLYARRDGGWTSAAYRDIYVTTPFAPYWSYTPNNPLEGYGYGNADRRLPGLPAAGALLNTLTATFSWPELCARPPTNCRPTRAATSTARCCSIRRSRPRWRQGLLHAHL